MSGSGRYPAYVITLEGLQLLDYWKAMESLWLAVVSRFSLTLARSPAARKPNIYAATAFKLT